MKIRVTKQQRANAVEALEVMWPSVPDANVSDRLNTWTAGDFDLRSETSCKTIACFGGWSARWPAFVAQGVSVNGYGEPILKSGGARAFHGRYVARALFGDTRLFLWRQPHEYNADTDHEVVTKRLRDLIRNSVVA